MTERNFTPSYTIEQRVPQSCKAKGKGFVVISLVHTATDLLVHILRTNPQILMHGELFNDIEADVVQASDLGSWTMDTRDESPSIFLRDVLACSEKLVGFLSRPEDWIDRHDTLMLMVNDPDIMKIILTGDHMRSFAACYKRTEEDEYFDAKLTISPDGIQRFLNTARKTELHCKELFHSSEVLWLTNEELISTSMEWSMQIFKHLGVDTNTADINAGQSFSDRTFELGAIEANFCPRLFLRHRILDREYDLIRYSHMTDAVSAKEETFNCSAIETSIPGQCSPIEESPKWALLVPIRSSGGSYDFENLQAFFRTLKRTLPPESQDRLLVYFGIDNDDAVLQTEFFGDSIKMIIGESLLVKTTILNEENGHVCRIWNSMAKQAIAEGCDFVVFLGDDITFEGNDWMNSIETKFRQVSSKTGLDCGVGCVAFNDLSFPHFPTFPVLHKSHFDIFGNVFCNRFINQGGDPYLFELYHRLGAAVIDESAKIRNGIGGNSPSRYEKRSIRFKNEILSRSLDIMRSRFGDASILPSLDVVVPTHRLNIDILRRILSLRVSIACQVKFWIVVDNPDHPCLSEVQTAFDGKAEDGNYKIQVLVHPKNLGASAARNTGIMRSCADWIVFFDDDVYPEESILDAYLAATFRNPDADALAGVTHLPKAKLWWQKALVLSGVTYFYQIASAMPTVPWSVTANLCVKGRTNNVMFRLGYPNSGGGEDVDFCFRFKKTGNGIVSVPDAVALHPWFASNVFEAIKHVMKWVTGDSMCVEVLPQHTYMVFPGWTEFLLFASVPAFSCGIFFKLTFLVISVEIIFKSLAFLTDSPSDEANPATAFVASLILMGQEAIRTGCHVKRRAPRAFCRRLDWFDGMNQSAIALSKRQHAVKFSIYLGLFCFLVLM